jgi:DNA-binding MarR family transcriptional regulator
VEGSRRYPMQSLDHLEKSKGTLRIIAYIKEKGGSKITDIIRDTGLSPNTVYTIVGRLVELNVISQGLSGGFPSKKGYTLSKEGQKLAKCIETMRVIISDLEKKK